MELCGDKLDAERFKSFDRNSFSFEDILHEFRRHHRDDGQYRNRSGGYLATGEAADAGLPGRADCWRCSVTGSLHVFQGEDREPADAESPANLRGVWSGQLVLEVPLRCGSLVRGRLRIRSRGAGAVSLRSETVRRLNTLCTIGASALDRLCLQEEWPWDDDVAHLSDSPGADSDHGSAETEKAIPQTPRLQDATFLNAVLPFALSQARRHLEPLSIVCVSIDRLRGIQDLLGRAAVDRLVRDVGKTVGTMIRGSDFVVRLDDDRVVAVLPRRREGALEVAKRICSAVASKTQGRCSNPSVTVSIGVATFPSCADNVLSLFSAADEALERRRTRAETRPPLLLHGRLSRVRSRTPFLVRPLDREQPAVFPVARMISCRIE